MSMIDVGLVGVTGYTGMELVRLLAGHGVMRLVRATSRTEAGQRLDQVHPFMQGFDVGRLVVADADPDDLAASCQLVFLAVPHGTAMDMAGELRDRGVKVVDLSADFRLRDAAVYSAWYGLEHRRLDLLETAVYGLPELYGDRIAGASLTANTGCYPITAILGLYPALKHGLVETQDIVIDSKSGTSGAGRKQATATLFCEVHDTFRPYNLGRHRHTPEIEQELSAIAGTEVKVTFSPHLVPMSRGILSTIYTKMRNPGDAERIRGMYEEAYAKSPWVRVLPEGRLPETRYVRGTMFCDIAVVPDARTGRLIIASAIDNICRGASGQAVACANLMLGLDIATGLTAAPLML